MRDSTANFQGPKPLRTPDRECRRCSARWYLAARRYFFKSPIHQKPWREKSGTFWIRTANKELSVSVRRSKFCRSQFASTLAGFGNAGDREAD